MSLNFTVQPGKIFTAGEKPTTAKLNQLGVPVITAVGSTGPSDMAQSDYSTTLAAGAYFYSLATLTSLNYAATYNPPVTSYVDGMFVRFKANVVNPAAATFNAGGGVKPIYKYGGSLAVEAGDIPAGSIVVMQYNSSLNAAAGGWELLTLLPEKREAEMQGASATRNGASGIVPAPKVGEQTYVLGGDGRFRSITTEIDARIAASAAYVATLNNLPLYLTSSN